jgi:hypothetical protein
MPPLVFLADLFIVPLRHAQAAHRTVFSVDLFSSAQVLCWRNSSMVVLLHGGVKSDEKFSCVRLRYGEKQKFPGSAMWFFSLAEM